MLSRSYISVVANIFDKEFYVKYDDYDPILIIR
jgi:hypothetical protein